MVVWNSLTLKPMLIDSYSHMCSMFRKLIEDEKKPNISAQCLKHGFQ